MGKESNVELANTMDFLLNSFVTSLANAAQVLDKKFEDGDFKDHPVKYAIPKMSIDMKLTLGIENGVVKGVFKKKSTSNAQELISTITMDVVAVPREPYENKGK